MDVQTQFRDFATSLIGETISHVWRGYGSAIFYEIGELTPHSGGSSRNAAGEVSLCVEWSWRIEDDHSILCGSWSDEEIWEQAFDQFRGASIAACELFGILPEIILTTATGIRLLSFSTTDGQPQWSVKDGRHDPVRWFTVRDGVLHIGDGTEVAE